MFHTPCKILQGEMGNKINGMKISLRYQRRCARRKQGNRVAGNNLNRVKVLDLDKEIVRGNFYLRSLVIKTGKNNIANRTVVLLVMKMLGILNMAMLIIGMNDVVNILYSIKPQEYPEEK
jgi:hypothetical protein